MGVNMDNVTNIEVGVKKKAVLMGQTKPRIMSIPLKGKSLGDDFQEFAAKCGYTMMPWQKYISDDFLTKDSDGNFIRKTIAVLCARQNAKTTLMVYRILYGLFVLGEMNVVAMSSKRGMAEDTFREVCGVIDRNDFLRCQVKLNRGEVGYRGNGKEHLDLLNGARYEIVAGNADGARGKSADLLFLDEARFISEEAYAAAKPLTIAKGPNAQTYITSNAGDNFSSVLNSLRDRHLSYPHPSLGWYEYSAPQHCKVTDKKGWSFANPALGITITEAGLEEALATVSIDKFLPEHLCVWVSSLSSPWPIGSWEAIADRTLKLPPGPVTFFAFDVAQGRRTASLVAGQYLDDGRVGVGLLDTWKADAAVDDLVIASKIKEWADLYKPQMICFDHYATASIAARLTASNQHMVDVSGTAFYQASGDLLDSIVAKRIVHAGQELMDAQMQACAGKNRDESWRIVRRASAGDVSGPIALAMIVHKMNEPQSVPMIIAG